MGTQYDPKKNDKLEERAKEMVEFYMARRDKMGGRGITECLRRVAQENPPLYAHLNRELTEYKRAERKNRHPE